jgi:C4-dicarboxylate-specific signal transduction histidine kinase
MAGAELQRENIAVKTECPATLPEIFTDRHKILQILINLITNARQALGEKPRNERILRITATCGDGENLVRIIVRDNGCGIAPENMTLIFNHGFTTKKSGHGFGLHSSANAAKEVGGNLTATSDGQGLGAVFTLELPVKIAAQEPMPAI